MKAFIGIDVGTSTVKTAIFDAYGHSYSIARRSIDIEVPKSGYAEQDPEMWWKAVKETITEALVTSGLSASEINAIGLSGQMHGAVMLDENGFAVRPAIIWNDQRSTEQVKVLKEIAGSKLSEYTLNTAATGFQLVSLMWLRDHCIDDYKRIRYVVAPKDYIRFKLTGKIGTECTDASATLAFNNKKLSWCNELIDMVGIDTGFFPQTEYPQSIAGEVTRKVSEDTGLRVGTAVVYGGADQAMQAVGNGIIRHGTASLTIGTGGQLVAPVDAPIYDLALRTNTFCGAPKGSWYIMGATLSAGLSLKWLTKKVLRNQDYQKLDAEAEGIEPGCGGLMFMPYLGGERTPHMDPMIRGSFWGLTLEHTDIHMYRAVMEGVAFSIRDCLNVFESMGIRIDQLLTAGGGMQSRVWAGILSDVLGKELHLTGVEEQACLGAAITAAIGVGEYKSFASACESMVPVSIGRIVPNDARYNVYQKSYAAYKDWYTVNKTLSPVIMNS